MDVFIEYGIDFDNNKYGLGKSIELSDNKKEIRIKKSIKLKIVKGFYIRLWICKKIIILSTFTPILKLQNKSRYNFKIVFGIAGVIN